MTRTDPPETGLVQTLTVVMLGRTSLNVAARMAYPFLPTISRGLGVPLTTATAMVTARSALGLTSPVFGPLADRYGRRTVMVAGLAVLAVGGALCSSQVVIGLFFIGFALMGLGKVLFDPSLQAYLSDRVPYAQRGRVLGLTELSWAGANLVGLPLVGLLIERQGWQAPFAVLALLGIASALVTWRGLSPARTVRSHAAPAGSAQVGAKQVSLLFARSPLAAMAMGLLLTAANENLFIVYGAWMEQSFGLGAAGLGLIASVVGVAELLGESLSAGIVDLLGKRRSVLLGALLSAASYAVLPTLSGRLAWAVAGLFILLLGFEFTVVSSFPLVSELLPQARGTMMSVNLAALSAGRVIGAPMGALLWQVGGFSTNGLVSGLMNLAAVALLVWGVREGGPVAHVVTSSPQ
jgi:predicted MFS family arabinose efflux permease